MKYLAILLLIVTPTLSNAETYIGFHAGKAEYSSMDQDHLIDIGGTIALSGGSFSISEDSSSSGLSVYFGKKINNTISVELGYTSIGTSDVSLTGSTANSPNPGETTLRSVETSVNVDGLTLSGVATLNVNQYFRPILKIGVLSYRAEFDTNDTTRILDGVGLTIGLNETTTSNTSNGISPTLSAGILIPLHKKLTLNAVASRYYDVDGMGITHYGIGIISNF